VFGEPHIYDCTDMKTAKHELNNMVRLAKRFEWDARIVGKVFNKFEDVKRLIRTTRETKRF
jgi:hypothetical protein